MRYNNIITAIPGSVIIWYNHCHDSTQSSPLLFWGVCHEDGDTTPYVIPFTIDSESSQATPFELPIREWPETDPRHGMESCIIAMEIPGWGRIQADANSPVYGNHPAQVKGYDSDFLSVANQTNTNTPEKHCKFRPGDMVRKTKGSQWRGVVVGWYSTDLTPEGYAVESSSEKGSVQIYPAAALELYDGGGL